VTPTHAAVVAQPAQPPIPFRSEDSGLGAHTVSTLGVAVVLLAAAWAGALVAKRRGWLARWLPVAGNAPTQSRVLLAARLRLSPKTVVYEVVTSGQEHVLVAESASGVQMLTLPRTPEASP
jgi:hypothetical protein